MSGSLICVCSKITILFGTNGSIRQTLRRGLASRPTFGVLGCSLKLWWLQPCHEQYCGSKPACASIIVFSSAQADILRCADAMSALGQKRTSHHVRVMSALPPIADMVQRDPGVRFVPNADSCSAANSRAGDDPARLTPSGVMLCAATPAMIATQSQPS